jgi:hypothetical protein
LVFIGMIVDKNQYFVSNWDIYAGLTIPGWFCGVLINGVVEHGWLRIDMELIKAWLRSQRVGGPSPPKPMFSLGYHKTPGSQENIYLPYCCSMYVVCLFVCRLLNLTLTSGRNELKLILMGDNTGYVLSYNLCSVCEERKH